jgi:hypothetical protein
MTPQYYLSGKLPEMDPQQRRWRLRLIVGEMVVSSRATGHPREHGLNCGNGSQFTSAERDGLAMLIWKMGRSFDGKLYGGSHDGATDVDLTQWGTP